MEFVSFGHCQLTPSAKKKAVTCHLIFLTSYLLNFCFFPLDRETCETSAKAFY
jgi:hypothetical protein